MYTGDSDNDYIYEIGPAVVRNKLDRKAEPTIDNTFYYTKTEHDGFYLIEDQNGKFIYPVFLQRAHYPILKINEPEIRPATNGIMHIMGNLYEEKARLRERNTENLGVNAKGAPNPSISTRTRDKVIGLRLEKWPMEIKQNFLLRNQNHKKYTGRGSKFVDFFSIFIKTTKS